MWQWLVDNVPTVLQKMWGIGFAIGKWVITDFVPWLAKTWFSVSKVLWGWIVDAIPVVLKKLGEWGLALGKWIITEAVPFLAEKALELGKKLVSWAIDFIPDMLVNLGTFMARIGTWIVTTGLPKLAGYALNMATSLATFGAKLVTKVPGAMLRAVLKIGSWIIDNGPSIVSKGTSIATKIAEGIGSIAAKAWEAVKGIPGYLTSKLGTIGTALINPGQTTFVTRLTNGINGSSPYGTAEAVQNLGADNSNSYRAHELTRVFRTLFGRVPDYEGYDYWLDRRWTDASIATVVAGFFGSPEYASKHGGKTDTQFMTYLYQNGLGRNPDNGGLNWWVDEINDHGRQDVVRRFSQSEEAVDHQETMTVVAQLYLGVLEKTPNANGFPTFVNRIDNQGWTPADVAREFMGYNNYWLSC